MNASKMTLYEFIQVSPYFFMEIHLEEQSSLESFYLDDCTWVDPQFG